MAFFLTRLPQARIRHVVVIALTAEGIPAAFHTAVRANRCSAVSAFTNGSLAAWHSDVTIAVSVFDLAVEIPEKRHEKAPDSVKSWGISVRLSPE